MSAGEGVSVFERARRELPAMLGGRITARVRRAVGLVLEVSAMPVPVGSLCRVHARIGDRPVPAEVVGFREGETLLMPLGEMRGVGPGDRVECLSVQQFVPVGPHLLGRVLDGRGRAMDGLGPIFSTATRPVFSDPPDPVSRPRIDEPLCTGVRAIDAFTTVGRGQRIGIFSGTGVGKSVLMGMISRFTAADVSVIALVGERNREVREFIENDLGPDGLARSVVVVATSDQPAPVRVKAPFVATAIAEYFRDQGLDVALLMDSVTRMAMAQREIGNSIGEVPASKGYPPSVFGMIPRLMERAGRSPAGSLTAFYTVLVEGDDLNEPISDAARGTLDGHIALSRRLAHRGHYPAVDVLESISRVMPKVTAPEHQEAARRMRELLSVYNEHEDMITIGAYVEGTNARVDTACRVMEPLNAFLRQRMAEGSDLETTVKQLTELQRLADQSPPQQQQQRRAAPGGRNRPGQGG